MAGSARTGLVFSSVLVLQGDLDEPGIADLRRWFGGGSSAPPRPGASSTAGTIWPWSTRWDAGGVSSRRIAVCVEVAPKQTVASVSVQRGPAATLGTEELKSRQRRIRMLDQGLIEPSAAAGADRARGAVPTVEWAGPERQLAAAWAEVLGAPPRSAEDNFFLAGGDSIRSIGLVVAARARGLALCVDRIFSAPTLHRMATAAEGPRAGQDAAGAPVRPAVRRGSSSGRRLPRRPARDCGPVRAGAVRRPALPHRRLGPAARRRPA